MSDEKKGTSIGTIDRVEGEIMVVELENLEMVDIPKSWLDSKARDGLSIIIDFDKKICRPDEIRTEQAKKDVQALMDDLFE